MQKACTLFFLYLTFFINSTSFAQKVETQQKENPIFPVFNIDDLNAFEPGKKLSDIPSKFGTGENIKIQRALEIKKFTMIHEAYVFPIWVQYFNEIIIDYYTRLPSYFLHDTFHQSLINRYGNQNIYTLKDSTAVYTWENEQTKRIYSGGCTITCYPIFYAVINKTPNKIPTTYKPLADHFVTTGFE